VLRARPCGEIIAAFGHELEREIGSMHGSGQILPSKEWSALPTSKSGPFDCRSCAAVIPNHLPWHPPCASNRNEFLENRLDPDVAAATFC